MTKQLTKTERRILELAKAFDYYVNGDLEAVSRWIGTSPCRLSAFYLYLHKMNSDTAHAFMRDYHNIAKHWRHVS